MKKHPNSPHLSIKRLRELASKFKKSKYVSVHYDMTEVYDFISFIELSRPSLNKKTK